MEFLEEIYTSAPNLIDGGASGNLGVVAKSRDFPRDIEADLSYQRAYSFLEDLPLTDPAAHPPRLLMQRAGLGKGMLCITQVVFAGADHTGRTAPLAHHLLFELQAMDREGLSASNILTQSRDLFYRQWRRGPTWLEPPRVLVQARVERSAPCAWGHFLSAEQLPTVLAVAAQALLVFASTHRAVVFALPREASHGIHVLMAEILELLPPRVQATLECASHVVEDSDSPQEAALVFSYPDSPFFQRHAARQDASAPLVLDLTHPETLPNKVNGTFGIRIAEALRQNDATAQVVALGAEWEALGLQGTQAELFARLLDLRDSLGSVTVDTPLGPLVEEITALSNQSSASTERIGQWCCDMLQHRVIGFPPDHRWKAVAAICREPHWPHKLQQAAIEMVATHANEALPALTGALLTTPSSADGLDEELPRIVAQNPGAVVAAIARAAETGTQQDFDVALQLMEWTNSNSPSLIKSWNETSMTASTNVRANFLSYFYQRLRKCPLGDSDLRELRDSCFSEDVADVEFASQCYLPLLQDLLDRGGAPEFWKRVATDSVGMAVRIHQIDEHLQYLAQRHKTCLTRDLLQEWIMTTRRKFGEMIAGDLQNAIKRAGLYSVLVPPRPIEDGRLNPGMERRDPFAKNLPLNDDPPPRGGRWIFLLSVLAVLWMMLIGCLPFFVSFGDGDIPFSRQLVLYTCFGGPLLFLITKVIQVLWLRRAAFLRWVSLLNAVVFIVLAWGNFVAIWWTSDNLPRTWATWVNQTLHHNVLNPTSAPPETKTDSALNPTSLPLSSTPKAGEVRP